MWIYEHKDWPHFTWNPESISMLLAQVKHRQGFLLGKMESLGFELRTEANLNTLTTEIVKSSAIEGETLKANEVRSSIANKLGISIANPLPTNRYTQGVVDMMLDATQNFSDSLSKTRLLQWHTLLFPASQNQWTSINAGNWRTTTSGPMQVVSGPVGRTEVHFEAPNAKSLEKEMRVFLKWFNNNQDLDPILKAGVAHLWFVTIHPFEDGNGRIARALSDMLLARADGTSRRFYSMSSQIEIERKNYYLKLEEQQRGTPDITGWLVWFLSCYERTINNAENALSHILFKAKLWEHINKNPVNARQRKIINSMLEESFKGYMNTSKYAKLAKCSNDTALRDIQNLKARGIFIQNSSGGRSTSYQLTTKVPNEK